MPTAVTDGFRLRLGHPKQKIERRAAFSVWLRVGPKIYSQDSKIVLNYKIRATILPHGDGSENQKKKFMKS